MGTYVAIALDATWPDAAGMGQENPLAPHPARDLHAPVLAMLAKAPLHIGGGTKRILTSWLRLDLRRVLTQAILLSSHFQESKPALCKGIVRD